THKSDILNFSTDNAAVPSPYLTVDGAQFYYSLGAANGKFTKDQVLDIVVNDIDADANDSQTDGTIAGSVNLNAKGKALLIHWEDTSLGGSVKRCSLAVRSGASACILYNNGASPVSITGASEIPSLFTSNAAGKAIIADIKAGKKPQVMVTFKEFQNPLPTAATLSAFSSPGLDLELYFLGGVGGQVLSTVSPHAAEANGFKQPYGLLGNISFELREYHQNSASLRNIFGSNFTHSPAYQGAGLVNAYWAAISKTLVLPSAIALNDTTSQNYYLNHFPVATVNPLLQGDDYTQDATTTTFTDQTPATLKFNGDEGYGGEACDFKLVRVPAGKSVKVSFKITPPAIDGSLYPIYGGYINIVNDEDDNIITVPYAGVVGDWKNRPIWTRKSPSVAAPNAIVNGTKGGFVTGLPAATSRVGSIQVVYQGNDLTAFQKLGFTGNSAYAFLSSTYNSFYGGGKIQRRTYSSNVIDTWNGLAVNADQTGSVS
ncbi:UNVERIFIED_CONTAM: hypothetical protein HDU68_008447, partial [Siphonaria sp. JEL0065]